MKNHLIVTGAVALAAFVVMGCSGGSDDHTGSSNAAGSAAEHAPAAGGDPVSNAIGKAAEVSSCLGLVKQKQWPDAVAACTKAAGVEPQNQEVQTALNSAREQLAASKVADAEQAAKGAANSAMKDADNKMKDATKGLMGDH